MVTASLPGGITSTLPLDWQQNRVYSVFLQSSSTSPAGTAPVHLDYRLVFIASCLLSLWLIILDPIINRDAIIYLRTADAYLQSGLIAGQSQFDRPLLAIIFALVHKFTGIPLVYAGQIVVSLFYALLATSFVATVRLIGGDRRVQILAAIIILSHPKLNTSRASIMRDPAYWAMCMLAFRELLLYARSPQLKHQLCWFLYVGVASLLRFEGIFFAAFAPLAMFIVSDRERRWSNAIRLALLPILTAATLAAIVLLYQQSSTSGDQLFQDIRSYISNFFHVLGKFESTVAEPLHTWLHEHSQEDASAAALAGLAAVLVLNLCRAMTWPYVAVYLWATTKGLFDRIQPRDRTLINAHLLVSLLYLALFLLSKRFMLERYSGIFTLYLLLYLPFILNSLWTRGAKSGGKIIVILLLLGMSLDSVHNRDYEKYFIVDASNWVVANTPGDASISTNSSYIAYFSKRQFNWARGTFGLRYKVEDLKSIEKRWRDKDYLIVMMKVHEEESWQDFLSEAGLSELQTFDGGRHGKIAVVQLPGGK